MNSFEHVNVDTVEDAISSLDADWKARIIAGGTDLLGEMKREIISPKRLVNLKTIKDSSYIRYSEEEGLKIGALTTLSDIESSEIVLEKFSLLSQAVSQVGTPQLRNMGTIGGNICQRPRCWYYRNPHYPCLRKGGRRCYAAAGENRYHAILGGGPCFIVHPSDVAPALIALGASLEIANPEGRRVIPMEEFFVGPKIDPYRENILKSNEIITEIRVPSPRENSRGIYFKAMERKAWDFATVSVASQITFDDGIVSSARIVLGGVAPIPCRTPDAEAVVQGKAVDEKTAEQAAEIALANSRPLRDNAYKIELTKALVKRALLNC
ncbi:TPA: xanthine dehydrogenase family protein subunit M [Candidatus Poribacteria bacterium]|nr:xanthine dehydrogenase family protein subunit M [Candidatus Poribacteria bacterium]